MKTKVNSNSSVLILPCVLLGIGLAVFFFYQTLDSNLERGFIIVAGLMILIPILPSIINLGVRNLLNYNPSGNKRPRITIDNQGNIIQPKINTTSKNSDKEGTDTKTEKKYKTKTCTTKGYSEIKEMIIKSSQNKEMDRECVINLVEEIDGLLGIHRRLYDTMKFTNDFHEIYTKLKSSKLTEADYEYLFEWLNHELGKENEVIVKDIKDIKDTKMELLNNLNERMGYLLANELELAKELFGGSFEVGVKYYEHDRQMISLEEITNLTDKMQEDIKEVCIVADDYRFLREVLKEEIGNDVVGIGNIIREYQEVRFRQ